MSTIRNRWELIDEILTYRATESINKYIKAFGIDSLDENNSTLLHELCSRGTSELVAYTISKGAKLDVIDEGGYTPLALACSSYSQKSALVLIEAGADVNLGKGHYPLIQAVYGSVHSRSTKVIETLLEHGAKLDTKDSVLGFTALDYAEVWGHEEAAALLKLYAADLERKSIEAVMTTKTATKKTLKL